MNYDEINKIMADIDRLSRESGISNTGSAKTVSPMSSQLFSSRESAVNSRPFSQTVSENNVSQDTSGAYGTSSSLDDSSKKEKENEKENKMTELERVITKSISEAIEEAFKNF